MAAWKLLIELALLSMVDAFVIRNETRLNPTGIEREENITDVFNGVYTECFLHLSYSCVQRKTLLYLKELGKLEEVSVIGDYVKFVKLNSTENEDIAEEDTRGKNSEDLSFLIDRAVDKFFSSHVMKFSALGRDISIPKTGEEFVGRKKRKGGGGGHGGGHDDGGKKKMMMMAMMCMKMKLMMMVPAMMGMMGMMSFKGMMFSMMSFMISKMMLLMKILEKKGGGGGIGGGGGGDGGWPAGGGGAGAWMPAGGDYGGGGGYDANGQWQSRSIFELEPTSKPVISYVTPIRSKIKESEYKSRSKRSIIDVIQDFVYKPKSRNRRSIIDVIQNAYDYWLNRLLGNTIRRKMKQPYKVVNGVKYVYYPMKVLQKAKTPKEVTVKNPDDLKPIVIADDFNKGEIVEGPVQSRMNKKKFNKMKEDLNDVVDDNPWE